MVEYDFKKINDYEILFLVNEKNENAEEILINKYKNLINKYIEEYKNIAVQNGLEECDLYQEGLLGLTNAIKTFDQSKEASFFTYANICIKTKIQTAIRNSSSKKNIALNNKSNVEPVYMALGDQNNEIYIDDSNVSSGNVLNIKNTGNKVQMTTLDSFVEKNNIKVGLIKTDLEGFEQPFLRGALNTIKKQKPVLIISIYHNYSDFFDIKPMIEELDLGYKFKILKSNDFNIILETKLIAEVY